MALISGMKLAGFYFEFDVVSSRWGFLFLLRGVSIKCHLPWSRLGLSLRTIVFFRVPTDSCVVTFSFGFCFCYLPLLSVPRLELISEADPSLKLLLLLLLLLRVVAVVLLLLMIQFPGRERGKEIQNDFEKNYQFPFR